MNFIKQYTSLLLLILFSLPVLANEKSEKIDQLIQSYHDIKEFNGNILVAQNGNILLQKSYGYANFEWDIPNTPDTKFRIASITKQFTAMLIMLLAEEGKVDLQQTISTYLPNYRKDTAKQVTIHHLLNHTSGIPSFFKHPEYRQIDMQNPYSLDEFIEKFCSGNLEFRPGSNFAYSNSGYTILGRIIEEVTSKSYWQVLENKILNPLNMTNTGNDATKPLLKNRAYGYEKDFISYYNAKYTDMSIPYAGGSMYSTTGDLMRWDVALNANKLLDQSRYAQIYQTSEHQNYGYGWMIDKLNTQTYGKALTQVSHAGMIQGFNTQIARILEDKYLIVILNNTGGAPIRGMTTGILNILYGKPFKLAQPRIFNVLYDTIKVKGLEAALAQYQTMHENGSGFSERSMNYFGYELMKVNELEAAIAFFKLNVLHAPDSSNVYDSLAEAYLTNGQYQLALTNYQVALEKNNENNNAQQAIVTIKHKLSQQQNNLVE